MVRVDEPDLIYKTEDAKFTPSSTTSPSGTTTGQPVLVGTASVEKSEQLSRLLDKQGIPHTVLNAKQHAREAAIVAQAGRLHAVTVATNMAGRGVDIVLGGNPEGLAREEVGAEGLDLESEEGQARYAELGGEVHRRSALPRPTRCAPSAGCTSSGASGTRAAASTTSSGAVPAGRATLARAVSTCRSRTS